MEVNEIKKELYKNKPKAVCVSDNGVVKVYSCELLGHDKLFFDVPCNDMGDSSFENELDAQLLIRWLRVPSPEQIANKSKERVFTFHKSSANNRDENGELIIEEVHVKESELNQPQKDLLLGEMIKTWDNMPKEIQEEFAQHISK